MLKANLKIAVRKLWKSRLYNLLNIGALTVGLMGFIFMLLYRHHLTQYDAWDPGYKNVYQVAYINKKYDGGVGQQWLSPHLLPALQQNVAAIDAGTRVCDNKMGSLLRVGEDRFYEKDLLQVDSTFFDVFPFSLTEGAAKNVLQAPNAMVVSEAFARRHFGNADPLGKVVRLQEQTDYTITGVMATPKGPTRVKADVLIRFVVPAWAGWGNLAYRTYVKLKPGANVPQVTETMTHTFLEAAFAEMSEWMKNWPKSIDALLATPGHEHLVLYPVSAIKAIEMRVPLMVLLLLACIILAVACVNFTNLSIANASTRGKEIGVRKVMGAARAAITRQFLLETFIQCLVALALAMTLVELLMPAFNNLAKENISFGHYLQAFSFVRQLVGALLLVTLAAGLYPAFYMAAFMPSKVLKGNFSRGKSGMWLRKFLLGFQFSFSIAFVIALVVISRQMDYMRHYDYGFQPGSLVYISNQDVHTSCNTAGVRARLEAVPHVQQASFTDYVPWVDEGNNGNTFRYKDNKEIEQTINVSDDYFSVIGATLLQGRQSDAAHPDDTSNAVVINEAMVKAMHIEAPVVGKSIVFEDFGGSGTDRNVEVIGVVKDFMIQGFESSVRPLVFIKRAKSYFDYTVLRIEPGYETEVMQQVAALWKDVEPAYPIIYNTVNGNLDREMESYRKLQQVVSMFSICTILIALVGPLALVAFNIQRRIREIGIRKVLGASTADLLQLVNGEYVWMVGFAIVAAFGLAFLLMRRFLNFFIYRIDMPWTVFVETAVGAVIVVATVISWRAWKAATANPVQVLKYE